MTPAAPPPDTPPRSSGRKGWWQQLGRVALMPMMLSVLCGLGIIQTVFHIGNGVYRSVTWSEEAQATQAENERLKRDIQILQDARVQLNSPQYLEQLARCWGYVGRDEQILVVEDVDVRVGSNCDEYRLP